VLEQPPNFRTREVCIYHQAGLGFDEFFQTIGSHLVANRSGTTILPNDRVEDWFTRFSIPNYHRFALICDTDGRDFFQIDIRTADSVSSDFDLRRPDLVRIMLDPAGLREKLSEFFLGDGDHFSGVID
jgi:hypothetical protein